MGKIGLLFILILTILALAVLFGIAVGVLNIYCDAGVLICTT